MKNNKGFVLVETLIVSLFVLSIFTLLFEQFYPLVGEYERIEAYDDIDSKYTAHWFRKMIVSDPYKDALLNRGFLTACSYNCRKLDRTFCDSLKQTPTKNNQLFCKNFFDHSNISIVYLIPYDTTTFKATVAADTSNTTYSRSLQEYVNYLPKYNNITLKSGSSNYFRLIVEIKHDISKPYYSYATIEVKK